VLGCCIAVYANTIGIGLVADDFWLLHSARGCDLRCALTTSPAVWGGFYRPMHVIFYRLGYVATGPDPLAYHVAAVALHAGVSLLLYTVMRALGEGSLASALGALLFAIAPFHTNAVTWPAGAEYSLVALWLLLGLLAYVRSRQSAPRSVVWRSLSLLAFAGALMSQESAVVLPALLLLYEILVARRDAATWRRSVRRLGPYVLLDTVYLWYSRGIVGARGIDFGQTPYSYAIGLNIVRNIGYFAANLLSPIDLYPLLNTLGDISGVMNLVRQMPVAVLPLAAAAVLWLFAVWSYWAARSRVLLFWSLFTLILLSPFVLRVHVSELYLYLPSIGSCAAAGTLVALIYGAKFPVGAQRLRLAPVGLAAAVALIFAASTVGRNVTYHAVGATGDSILHGLQAAYPELPDGTTLYFADEPGIACGLSVMGLRGVEVFESYGIAPAIKMAYDNESLDARLVGYDDMMTLLARPDCEQGDALYFVWQGSRLVEAGCRPLAQFRARACTS
jgi:hypothetical protein